jgi:putative sulfurtransferase DndC
MPGAGLSCAQESTHADDRHQQARNRDRTRRGFGDDGNHAEIVEKDVLLAIIDQVLQHERPRFLCGPPHFWLGTAVCDERQLVRHFAFRSSIGVDKPPTMSAIAEQPQNSISVYESIRESLRRLYLSDPRPWIVGFSGGKDSTMVASLIFEVVASIPENQRIKPIAVLSTDTRVEIPAIVEMLERTLSRMQRFAAQGHLNAEVHLLRPSAENSFWVNIIGRGYPPPNRTFRWCTQRMKIDPVSEWIRRRVQEWGDAILHLGARRSESSTRAQAMAGREAKGGLRRHIDLPKVWISNPIEFLTTEEVWAYLLQRNPPWGGTNRELYQLYANAAGGECPMVVDQSTPSCGNSRFGCWTCTVVERDRASEGLLSSGDDRMEELIAFRQTLIDYRDPANGKRDDRRMNGAKGPGPLTMTARRELLHKLLKLQEQTAIKLISEEELFLIQKFWNSARNPDDGGGVARIVTRQRGIHMSDLKEVNRLRELQEQVASEKGLSADTLRRMLAKVEEYSESHRAVRLPDDLVKILKDDAETAA